MSNLLDFYFLQLVQESDMDDLQLNLETSQRQLFTDQQYSGIASGYGVVQHAPTPDFTVDVAGPGIAYDDNGRRIFLPAPVNLDVSLDSQGAPTAVVNPGNEKWISVFTQFERNPSDTRFDGNGLPVNFRQDEGQKFVVVQGAEALAGTAAKPSILPDAKLIGDILVEFGTTQIVDGASDTAVPRIESADVAGKPLTRFPFMFNLTASSPAQVRVGPLPTAMQAILTELNNHISGVSNAHPADAISTTNTAPGWTDLAAATEVQASLDAVPSDLARTDNTTEGAGLVGMRWEDTLWRGEVYPGGSNTNTLLTALGTTAAGITGVGSVLSSTQELIDAACLREQMDEEYAVITQTDFPATGQYRLLYESGFDAFERGASRLYMFHDSDDLNPNSGMCFTQNAKWNTSTELWEADRTTQAAERFGAMPDLGNFGAKRISDTSVAWGDDAWYRDGWGTSIETRLEGSAEIASDTVGINCTSETTAPVFTAREYRCRFGALLDTTAANQNFGSVVNFPGSFFDTPTSFTFDNSAGVNVTSGPNVDGASSRGLVISRRSIASGFAWYAGDVQVNP
jgi:hypothetical protein